MSENNLKINKSVHIPTGDMSNKQIIATMDDCLKHFPIIHKRTEKVYYKRDQ